MSDAHAAASPMPQAVILAAGLGSRLGAQAAGKPKCLVEIAGVTLIERSLANLERAGIRDAVILLGFNGALVRALLGERFRGLRIRYVDNPDFAHTGNMYSLACAAPLVSSDTLILEADLIYRADAIPRLLAAPHPNTILAGALLHHGDDVIIRADDTGRVTDLGKHLPQTPDVIGALLGITRLSQAFMQALFAHAASDFARGERQFHYEETIMATSRTGAPVHALACPDIPWTEIDTPADLVRARDEVYPRIAEYEQAH